MKPLLFIPSEEQKKIAGEKSVEILNSLTKCSNDIPHQAYILQIVLECFEEEYDINIRGGLSISKEDKHRPKPKHSP